VTNAIDRKQNRVGSHGQGSKGVTAALQAAVVMQKIRTTFFCQPFQLWNLIGAATDIKKRFAAQIGFLTGTASAR
jgi:hypothetical protein